MARKKDERVSEKSQRKAQQYRSSNKPKEPEQSASDEVSDAALALPDLQVQSDVNPNNAYLRADDDHFVSFRQQLATLGLTLRDVQGDGNCLFRALGDQMEGHGKNHFQHRMDTVRYMISNKQDFEPFMEMPFERYMDSLSRLGTYAGQDALVAFARLHKLRIVIHQLNSPIWQIEGGGDDQCAELHLSYHNGEHYSSVRRVGDGAQTPARISLSSLLRAVTCSAAAHTSSAPKCVSAGRSNTCTVAASSAVCAAFLDSATEDEVDSGAEWMRYKKESQPATSDIVQTVMDCSGCTDPTLAEQALIDHDYNTELAVDYLVNLTLLLNKFDDNCPSVDAPSCDNKVTGDQAPVDQAEAAAVKTPRKNLSNRERKEQRRRDKTKRQTERRAERDGMQVVVSNIGLLNL